MVSFAEPGLVSVGCVVAIPGVGEGLIQCHAGILIPSKPLMGRPQLSVNSPAGNVYGSPSMDCRFALHPRDDRMVRLHGVAHAASAPTDPCFAHAGRDNG